MAEKSSIGLSDRQLKLVIRKQKEFRGEKIESETLLEEAFKIRHKIFCEQLGWVEPSKENGKEKDRYDKFATHFGVYDGEKLCGYFRLLNSDQEFMLEDEFNELHPGDKAVPGKGSSAEISRLAISSRRKKIKKFVTAMLLYRIIYQWFVKNNKQYCYVVVTEEYLQSLQKVFPFRKIGKINYYQPETATTAAIASLKETNKVLAETSEEFLKWLRTGLK